MPPCADCTNPTLCTDRCEVYAEQLRACEASGQMDSRQVSAHVEAGEMTLRKCDATGSACRSYCSTGECWMKAKARAAPKGEAGEMEAAKGDGK